MAVRRLAETQPESFAFSQDNQAWAEHTIRKFPQGRQASAVIPLLWRAQEQEGWVTKPAIESVAKMLAMPTIRVLEVATFYTMFHLEPVGRTAHVQVCGTTPCMLRGSDDIIDVCRRRIAPHPHEVSDDGAFSWEEVECLGACVNAPMVQIFKDTYEDLTRESFEALLDALQRGERPVPGPRIARQYSAPATGNTSLNEIAYADDDVASPAAPTPRAAVSQPSAPPARNPDDGASAAPRRSGEENAGGEVLEAESARRKGRTPRQRGGADPATVAAANQEIGRVDASGRSDEAASRAMNARSPARDKALPKEGSSVRKGRRGGGDKSAEPRSDRDSPAGDKEG